jgi:hypothetical protein
MSVRLPVGLVVGRAAVDNVSVPTAGPASGPAQQRDEQEQRHDCGNPDQERRPTSVPNRFGERLWNGCSLLGEIPTQASEIAEP